MVDNLSCLKKQIAEKNSILSSLNRDTDRNTEKIEQVKAELDSLLYSYYKSIRRDYKDIRISCQGIS